MTVSERHSGLLVALPLNQSAESNVGDVPMPAVTFAMDLSEELIERIARRAAALVSVRPPRDERGSPYLTIAEAAEFLRCRRQRVDDLLSQGRLTRIKDGARTLIARTDLEAHLAGRRGSSQTASSRKNGSGKSSGIR